MPQITGAKRGEGCNEPCVRGLPAYADMHCDTLTVAASEGCGLKENGLQADFKRLSAAGCAVQCFAVFTRGDDPRAFYSCAEYFNAQLAAARDICAPVLRYSDFERAKAEGKVGCVLTAENMGFVRSAQDVRRMYACGVRMASLVWNEENGLAFPNLVFKGNAPDFSVREARGLKDMGREVASALDELGVIIDVSHLSDGGLCDLLRGRERPLVASHSDCFSLSPVSRNLTDGQIRAIADCGGVVGVNFCLDFLGGEDAAERAFKHIEHIVNVCGEDCAAIGSDFDGMPVQRGMESCAEMPKLVGMIKTKFGGRVAEKIACGNFLRVFKEVCG